MNFLPTFLSIASNKQKRKRKRNTNAQLHNLQFKKKRIDYPTFIASKPASPSTVPSLLANNNTEPLVSEVVQQEESSHLFSGVQQIQNVHDLQNTQRVSNGQRAKVVSSSSYTHQISITNESARYARTRHPFPPFVIKFNSSEITARSN